MADPGYRAYVQKLWREVFKFDASEIEEWTARALAGDPEFERLFSERVEQAEETP